MNFLFSFFIFFLTLIQTTQFMFAFHSTSVKSNFNKIPVTITDTTSINKQYFLNSTQNKLDFYPAASLDDIDDNSDLKNTIVEYINDAANYIDNFEFKKALNTALMAYKLAKEEEDIELEILSLLLVAQINMYWDNAEVSSHIYIMIDEYRQTLNESLSQNLHLVTQLGHSSVYLKLNEPDKALTIINEVFKSHQNIYDTPFYQNFLWNSGIAYFKKEDFKQSFDSLNKVVKLSPTIYNKALLNYYKGSFYEKTESTETALPFYMRTDSLLFGQKEIIPEVKEVYGAINNYYLEKGDRLNQYEFLNKFLKTLNIHNDISGYVKNTTRELFEIPLLIEEKQLEIEKLKEQDIKNRRLTILIVCCLIVLLSLTVFYLVKQRNYKKRFEKLIQKNLNSNSESHPEFSNQSISLEVIENIMNKLEEFEENKEFLSNDISLNAIAKQFETNSSYLSKVVNLKKDKNFSNYINQLRIEYCLELLKTNKKIQNYTIKAIAEESGFNNAQSFSNAFYKFTGIYPSYFIEQIKKTEKKINN